MVFFELFTNGPDVRRVPAGQFLFSEGEEGGMMFVLSIGEAEVVVHGHVVESLQHGNIVGEMGLVSPGPRSASVIAVTDCEFVAIDEKRFHYLVQQTPFFATKVMRVLAERLRAADQFVRPLENA